MIYIYIYLFSGDTFFVLMFFGDNFPGRTSPQKNVLPNILGGIFTKRYFGKDKFSWKQFFREQFFKRVHFFVKKVPGLKKTCSSGPVIKTLAERRTAAGDAAASLRRVEVTFHFFCSVVFVSVLSAHRTSTPNGIEQFLSRFLTLFF